MNRISLSMMALVAAAFSLTAPAFADGGYKGSVKDAPVAEPERRCSGGPFAGAYVGLQTGWVRSDLDLEDRNPPYAGYSTDGDGWSVGGYYGYGWQCDRLYFGFESDINWTNADSSFGIAGQVLESSYDYYGTSRVRLGLAHENVLVYVTGGLAYAKVEHELNWAAAGFSQSDDDRKWGWTIGGGIQLDRGRWGLKAEVLYVDLGEETHNYSFGSYCSYCTARVNWEDDFVVARLGVSFKLQREEQHVPLK